MINIFFNSEMISVERDTTLDNLLKQKVVTPYYAVAINREFIPRKSYTKIKLHNHDQVEIITPMQGG